MSVTVSSGTVPSRRQTARLSAAPARAVILAAIGAGAAAALLATDGAASSHAITASGADLTRLLRAMAALKSIMALAAAACVVWRLATPAPWPMLAGYAAACAGMAAGPVLIWGMVHVGAGALALHVGLGAVILLLWRDPAVAAQLATLVAARRRGFAL